MNVAFVPQRPYIAPGLLTESGFAHHMQEASDLTKQLSSSRPQQQQQRSKIHNTTAVTNYNNNGNTTTDDDQHNENNDTSFSEYLPSCTTVLW